jgi:nucleoside-diphosphate-sugar epimerase
MPARILPVPHAFRAWHGYQVAATDIAATREDLEAGTLRAAAVTFNANMAMNFNVFHAAASLGISRVVRASSETTLGLPFGMSPEQMPFLETEGLAPRYAPVDEDHYPVPTVTYALSKVASETIAGRLRRQRR